MLCNDELCNFCYLKSFASHSYSRYWSNDNTAFPRQILKKSSQKYWFLCANSHKTLIILKNIVDGNIVCSICKNKTERKLFDLLIKIYPVVQFQYKVDFCKNKTYLPYDFVLINDKIIIELDGILHFKDNTYFKYATHSEVHKNDLYKMKCANDNGFSVIRIYQPDVWHKNYNVDELVLTIEKIKKDNIIQNAFISNGNHYDIYLINSK